MDDKLPSLLPRFRYGLINPRAPGKVQRGLSYQFYRIVPPVQGWGRLLANGP